MLQQISEIKFCDKKVEKLTLSSEKCHNIHIGKSDMKCHNLKVHGSPMSNSKQETLHVAHWKVEAGLRLRQAMLISGILFNSEAWHGIEEKDIAILENVDEALLKDILSAHPKIPL